MASDEKNGGGFDELSQDDLSQLFEEAEAAVSDSPEVSSGDTLSPSDIASLFSEAERREMEAYHFMLSVSDADVQKQKEMSTPLALKVTRDLDRIREHHPNALNGIKKDDQIAMAAHHPDLLFPEDWVHTMLEDVKTQEMDEWLEAKETAMNLPEDER